MTNNRRLTRKAVEILDLLERIISAAEHAGEKTVELNTIGARIMVDLARCAPKPNTGQPKPRRKVQWEALVLRMANRQRDRSVSQGMNKAQARREAVAMIQKKLSHLNLRTIEDRLSAIRRKR